MSKPVLLELANLPREQIGPFLILGLPKQATKNQIEANWADRLKWVRRNLIKVPLEDINWAREQLSTPQQQVQADAASINTDTNSGYLTGLHSKYSMGPGEIWEPLDSPLPLGDDTPEIEIPSPEGVLAKIPQPEIPQDIVVLPILLEGIALTHLDPWTVELPPAGGASSMNSLRQDELK